VTCALLQCVAVCCSVLQCVAVCCSVLQCVAVCCSLLTCQELTTWHAPCCSVWQCVAVCCSLMTCQELTSCVVPPQKQHCNTLQHTAPHCNTLHQIATHIHLWHAQLLAYKLHHVPPKQLNSRNPLTPSGFTFVSIATGKTEAETWWSGIDIQKIRKNLDPF